jgi:hypothetical protein
MIWKSKKLTFCDIFYNPQVQNMKFGAGAASRYGSSSDKIMRLQAVLAPQHRPLWSSCYYHTVAVS